MKFKILFILFFASIFIAGCDKNDDNSNPINGQSHDDNPTMLDEDGESNLILLNTSDNTTTNVSSYNVFGRWVDLDLKYYFVNDDGDPNLNERNIIQIAFDVWSEVSDLEFSEVFQESEADIKIRWGDLPSSSILGRATTTYNSSTYLIINSDINFNNSIDWVNEPSPNYPQYDLLQVAIHEIGHSLGISHSEIQAAIMWDFYKGGGQRDLHQDDINAIQSQYPFNGEVPNSIFENEVYANNGWSNNWNVIRFFQIGQNTYLYRYRSDVGGVKIHKMNSDGTIGNNTESIDGWSLHWTHHELFEINGQVFLYRYRDDIGEFKIHKINSNGTLGSNVETVSNLSLNWNEHHLFKSGNNVYLYRYRSDVGSVKIHKINPDGTFGNNTESFDNWSLKWSHHGFIESANQTYLFRYRNDIGEVKIHKINDNGTLGSNTYSESIGSHQWTFFKFLNTPSNTYLFRYRNDIKGFITNRTNLSGQSMGSNIYSDIWTIGWKYYPFSVGDNNYMMMYNDNAGFVKIEELDLE
ncbi:MAG: matrixin family metalloprotease [Bacteroidota bacterium]